MKGIVLYLAIAAPFLAIPLVLALFGVDFQTGLSIAIVVAIVASIVATIYVANLYHQSTEPKSVFWGYLVSAMEVKVAFGGWVGYLVAANLLAAHELVLFGTRILLPLPDQATRQAFTGIAAVILLVTAVYYAVSITIERRTP